MGFMQSLRSRWTKDAREVAEEETRMTKVEREITKDDYGARKDDAMLRGDYIHGSAFERDSGRPRP
ncbi:MAG: hypothetical protein H0W87_05105 [Actinobacteria bacterium]|nr:hypothetical protein [Actinomycetota bacterium]